MNPLDGGKIVLLGADALGQAKPKVILRLGIASRGGLTQPTGNNLAFFLINLPRQRKVNQIGARGIVAACSRAVQPACGLRNVSWRPGAQHKDTSEGSSGANMSGFGRAPQPRRRLVIVRWGLAAACIQIADNRGGLCIPGQCSAA